MTRIRVKRQAVAPIIGAVADGGNRQGLSNHADNHNLVEEVINDDKHHRTVPLITGQLEQPANRQ